MDGLRIVAIAAPILGAVVSLAMYCSPVAAVYAARRRRDLGVLNPVPFAATCAVKAAWVGYGLVTRDANMFLPNIPGLTAALWMTVSCHALAGHKLQDVLLGLLCGSATALLLLGVATRFLALDGKLAWGIAANVANVAFYASPLSTAVSVLAQRDSGSIYRPSCAANLLNAGLWLTYGTVVHDPFIVVPNALGAALSIVLVGLTLLLPHSASAQALPAGAATAAPLPCSAKRPGGGQPADVLVISVGSITSSADSSSDAGSCAAAARGARCS